MRTFSIALLVAGLALAALPSIAAQGTTVQLEAVTEGAQNFFRQGTTKNPALAVTPGAEITVTMTNVGSGVHNFCVDLPGGKKCSEYVSADGETQSVTFTAPASGSAEYFCEPHKSAGMKGTMTFGSAPAPTNEEKNDSPGVQVLGVGLAMLGAALVVGRRRS